MEVILSGTGKKKTVKKQNKLFSAAGLLQKADVLNKVTAVTSLQRTTDDLKRKWFDLKLFSKKRAAVS